MKKSFESRLEAIDWIANNVENEGQFEVLREQLNYSFIYTGTYFVKLGKLNLEVEIV
jgi:hypothetical protein